MSGQRPLAPLLLLILLLLHTRPADMLTILSPRTLPRCPRTAHLTASALCEPSLSRLIFPPPAKARSLPPPIFLAVHDSSVQQTILPARPDALSRRRATANVRGAPSPYSWLSHRQFAPRPPASHGSQPSRHPFNGFDPLTIGMLSRHPQNTATPVKRLTLVFYSRLSQETIPTFVLYDRRPVLPIARSTDALRCVRTNTV
ncbi:hypothetical protein C8Q80DRAFT_571130 [Daedaleopsis nitida]|nr:hypothetical protein C8Q80DRAFT_571130 [Daedaleopsis nitida]